MLLKWLRLKTNFTEEKLKNLRYLLTYFNFLSKTLIKYQSIQVILNSKKDNDHLSKKLEIMQEENRTLNDTIEKLNIELVKNKRRLNQYQNENHE